MSALRDFYHGKKVLITGHTGFKGSWMSIFLNELGSKVIGYSLDPTNTEDLFLKARIGEFVEDIRGDILDRTHLEQVINIHKPEIVFHLAAQPLVIESYLDPVYTWNVNLFGTINLLESLKNKSFVKSIVIITTDKVYKNKETGKGYSESDELGGFDPYSASKAALEICVNSYRESFFNQKNSGSQAHITTVRAGNVLGGGDWGKHRLVPDFYRSFSKNEPFELRNPMSVRPWQHVLDVIYAYALIPSKTSNNQDSSFNVFNISNDNIMNITVKELMKRLNFNNQVILNEYQPNIEFVETKNLTLDSTKIRELLGWEGKIDLAECIHLVRDYYENYQIKDPKSIILSQINDYLKKYR